MATGYAQTAMPMSLLKMNELNTYYFIFGQTHPLRDNWIEIRAATSELARDEMLLLFGAKWLMQYEDADFNPKLFPLGKIGRAHV